jgi:cytochrome c oxidase subunit 3/cytochrome o ubiquinol oxidase subunit 3
MSEATARRVGEAEATAKRTNLAPLGNKEKLGVWFFLGGEVILFGTLILTYALFRITFADQYANFRSQLSIPLIGANTFVLIMSSYFVVRALQAIKEDRQNAFLLNLMVVLLLGSIFIGGQAYEWSQLFGQGIKLDNTFGSPFFIVTGIHGTHVLIGLAWVSIVLLFGAGRGYNSRNYRAMEFLGLYWHFVDIVWIILFSVIYLL